MFIKNTKMLLHFFSSSFIVFVIAIKTENFENQ